MSETTHWGNLADPTKLSAATAVLRVRLISRDPTANKYAWDIVEVLHIFKEPKGIEFSKTIRVAHYSWDPGIPPGESTIYLNHFDDTDGDTWKLASGSAADSVSHAQPE